MVLIGSATAQSQRKFPNDPPPHKTAEPERGPQTDKRGTPEHPLTVNVVPTTEQNADSEKKNASAEFKASDDRKLVEYTGYLVLVGIVQFGVFVLQLRAFTTQAHYMRRTVTEMQSATGAAIRAANAAEDTIGHMRETSKRQLRAYVHVADVNILYMDSEWCPNIRIRVKNYGQTPAYKVSNRSGNMMALIGEPVFSLPETIAHFSDLGPSQDQITTMIVSLSFWDQLLKPAVKGHAPPFFVFGQITYFDAFQDCASEDPHVTRYRFQLHIDDEWRTPLFVQR